jgi:N-acetylglucosamine-6-sulfatase
MHFIRLLSFLALLQSCVYGQFGSQASKVENPTQPTTRPNVVFLLTDDQDLHLDSLSYLPLLKKHLTDQGTFYSKHYCTIAICCPARVTLWTGKAAHNTVREICSWKKE